MKKAALALAAVLLGGTPSFAAADAGSGYLIDQRMSYHGSVRTMVSGLGTKIYAKELTIVEHPNHTAGVYNSTNRKFCILTDKNWLDKYAPPTRYGPIKKGASTVMFGHNVTQYYCEAWKIKVRPDDPPATAYYLEFLTAKDFDLPKGVADDSLALLGLPPGYGFPIKIVRHYQYGTPNQKSMIYMDTLALRPAHFTAADYSVPTGYTQSNDDMEVLIGESQDELDKMLNDTPTRRPGAANAAVPRRTR